MNDNIQIFACDHRKNVQWDLPYIRLGNSQSDAVVSIKDDAEIMPYHRLLSEGAQIWWVYKHYKDLGNPDFVGFCHYRRFLSTARNRGLIQFKDSNVDLDLVADPTTQLCIIKSTAANGIIPPPWYEDFFKNPKSKGYGQVADYEYAWEGAYYQLKTDGVGLTMDEVKLAYDKLFEFSNDDLKPYIQMAFREKTVHFCSIFTLQKDLFHLYCNTALKAIIAALRLYDKSHLLNDCNCRAGGYLLERVGSCLFHALKFKGLKLISLPMIVAESGNNPIYRHQTCKDVNMQGLTVMS